MRVLNEQPTYVGYEDRQLFDKSFTLGRTINVLSDWTNTTGRVFEFIGL